MFIHSDKITGAKIMLILIKKAKEIQVSGSIQTTVFFQMVLVELAHQIKKKIFMESSSGFNVEYYEHIIGDTYKLLESMSNSLNTMIRRKQDCKFSSVINLAVYGVQCIKSKLTLMKTTLYS
jgi:hypothetical protein